MSGDEILLTHAKKMAARDLFSIARLAVHLVAKRRFDYFDSELSNVMKDETDARRLQDRRDFTLHSMRIPDECVLRSNYGMFAEFPLEQILAACFTPEALNFLLDRAYNKYIFWDNILTAAWNLEFEPNFTMPITLDWLHLRLVQERGPFGLRGSENSKSKMLRLKSFIELCGGRFDASKLEPLYALELLEDGVLFRQQPIAGEAAATLVINPMWLAEVGALAQG